MASFDPRMIPMHAGIHHNSLDHVGQRYPQHQAGQHSDQQGQSGRLRQGSTTSESKTEAGPNWENVYRTAQNIGFPDPKVACGDVVGEFLEDTARGIGCPVEYVLVPMLPCIGGILGTKTTIRVHRAWSEPPVLWSIVGSAAGSRRSSVIRQLLSPILALQADREETEGQRSPKQIKLQGNGQFEENKKKNSVQRRALYTGTRITLTALTDVLHCNDGHAFSLAEDVENLHNLLMQPVTCPRLASVMDDLYEGLPLVAVEDGRVTTLLGTNFCQGGFARPEYIVRTMLKSPSWLSARFLLSCPQSDDMKGVFGDPVCSTELPELELIYSILLEKHQNRQNYAFDPDAVQELSKFFEEEWTSVLNQLDQNEHEGIIGKSMGQIVRLSGILKALENSLLSARAKSQARDQEWDWNITAGTVKKGIILGKYFMEQKLAMTFMVGTGFFNHYSEMSFDSGMNGNATTLPQTAIHVGSEQQCRWSPAANTSRSFSQDSTAANSLQGSQQNPNSSFSFSKRAGDVDFSTLPHTMSTVEEDVSEMMQAVDFVHFSKTQFVAVHGRRIKRLLECYDDGHGVSATTAAQKSITPPVRIEGTNNRHPAWASALFFQKVAELDLGAAEQGRHPTNRKVCWRFKRKPVGQLQEKDFQLLQYLRVEMEKYSQFGSGPFNPSMIVNSGLITLPNSSSPRHQVGGGLSPVVGGMDDDSNTTNSQNSSRNSATPIIKTEIY
ncbi:unnamed protein product [Lymnaea stagnalis]|uniref:Uncharacterized protein n=1 Tax=Lymnaea stagnalis TaxID=6523 RepID=A0AAV2H0U2_LYMST